MRAVPVFMYHHVNRHPGDLVTLSPQGFENHLRVLQKRGVRTLFLGELARLLRGEEPPPGPCAALTFDDGHLDNWVFAFPLLRKYRMKATVFVVTSWLGEGERRGLWTPGEEGEGGLPAIPRHGEAKRRAAEGDPGAALNWQEARAMEESGLVDIQSHTHLHRDYFLEGEKGIRLDPALRGPLREDLARSRELIETRLGKECRYLSWPWGKHDPEAQGIAREAGFQGMATTEKGVNAPGSGEAAIKRVVAKSGAERWFSRRLSIYSSRTVGRLYSRIVGKI